MAGVLAVMIFLAVLATAGGIATATASRALGATLAGQVTVQIVAPDADTRTRRAAQTLAAIRPRTVRPERAAASADCRIRTTPPSART